MWHIPYISPSLSCCLNNLWTFWFGSFIAHKHLLHNIVCWLILLEAATDILPLADLLNMVASKQQERYLNNRIVCIWMMDFINFIWLRLASKYRWTGIRYHPPCTIKQNTNLCADVFDNHTCTLMYGTTVLKNCGYLLLNKIMLQSVFCPIAPFLYVCL